jgi:polysaccharide biosynthesis PFTS motif protein
MRLWLRKKNLRRMRKLARDARTVQHSESPYKNLEICTALERIDPGVPSDAFHRFGRFASAARACVRQRLVATITFPYLLPEVMSLVANPRIPHAVTAPPAWREELRSRGFRLKSSSLLRWLGLIALVYAQALKSAAHRAWSVCVGAMPRRPGGNEYAVLMYLTPNMTPRGNALGFDFVSSYAQSSIRDPRVRQIWAHIHGGAVPSAIPSITITSQYLPSLNGLGSRLRFLVRLLSAIAAGTLRGLAGQWWEIVLLEQLSDFIYAGQLERHDFARAYVFNNARFIVRPLWTHIAEEAGATIDLAFYATNLEVFATKRVQQLPVWPGYSGMTWQRYLVWDDVHAGFIRALGITAPTIVTGPSGFTDSPNVQAPWPRPYMVVFDVTPQRPVSLAIRGIPHTYYTDEVWWQFITQVRTALTARGFHMVYKKKREIGRIATRRFRRAGAEWLNRNEVVIADPDLAPHRLIAEAAGVISMPFTSTAIIAQSMGKPTIYYDPLGVLVDERRLAHGIDVIGNTADLARWVAQLQQPDLVREPVS